METEGFFLFLFLPPEHQIAGVCVMFMEYDGGPFFHTLTNPAIV